MNPHSVATIPNGCLRLELDFQLVGRYFSDDKFWLQLRCCQGGLLGNLERLLIFREYLLEYGRASVFYSYLWLHNGHVGIELVLKCFLLEIRMRK